MKVLIPILIGLFVVGCGKKEDGNTGVVNPNSPSTESAPEKLIINPIIVEKAIRKAAKKPTGEPTKADYDKVTELDLSNKQLTEVPKGLEKLTKLTELDLSFNQLTDVKGLGKLTQLERLSLGFNQLTDVKGLEKLTKLTWLALGFNQLTDVKGLENLTQLKQLWIEDNPALTKDQIAKLQKALPNCKILSNPTK
jgi:Leucine-rich repeat (LRR) protein